MYASVCMCGGREGRGTAEAYLALSLQVGPFVQKHLRRFYMTLHSGVVKSSITTLFETDTHSERETSGSWYRFIDAILCTSIRL